MRELLNENIHKFITTHINIKTNEHHHLVFTSMEKMGALLTSYNKHKRKNQKTIMIKKEKKQEEEWEKKHVGEEK
jgi:hypothetical protein